MVYTHSISEFATFYFVVSKEIEVFGKKACLQLEGFATKDSQIC